MGQETSASAARIVETGAASTSVSVVRGIRRLLVSTVLTALVCSFLITASRGRCYTETNLCLDLKLSVSPVLFLGLAVVVLVALDRIIAGTLDSFEAMRVLDRAGLVVKIVAAVAILVAHAWFWAIPMDDFGSRGINILSPFLFGMIEVTTTPGG